MLFQRIIFCVVLLAALTFSRQTLQADDGLIFAQIGLAIPTGLSDQPIFGIEDTQVDVSASFLAQAGYLIAVGDHVSAGARLSYTKLNYEYDFGDPGNQPFAIPTEDQSALVMLQGIVEYRFNLDGFTPLFGISGGFIFGGPDTGDETFEDETDADFIFGFTGGVSFPIAPELVGYAQFQGDFPLNSSTVPSILGLMAGIAFQFN